MTKFITYSFREPFLDRLTDFIEENYLKHGKDISRLAIVFGGKRPALFLKRALARRLKTSFASPRFFTINEFMAYIVRQKASFGQALDLDNNFLLYQLAQKAAPEILIGRESFAQFLPWTQEILAFIDQLDLEDVEEQRLLNIQANAEIGYAVPEDINRLLQNTVDLRRAYHQAMQERKQYSRGYQYLRAAECARQLSFEEFDQVLICNFFYFNRCEEKVMQALWERDKAVFLFQGDERKWPVLNRIARRFSCTIREGEEVDIPCINFVNGSNTGKNGEVSLKLYKAFDIHSQVGLVSQIVKDTKNLDNTVIVLPNPDPIVPLLSEIAPLIKDFNISMGYPLKRSSLYALFEFIFQAQLSKKGEEYYTKDYLKVIRHPFVKNLQLGPKTAMTRILIHKIEEILIGKAMTTLSGSLFIDLEDVESLDELYMLTQQMCDRLGMTTSRGELQKILQTIHQIFFLNWEHIRNFQDFAGMLDHLLDVLIKKSFLKNYPLNLNIAVKIHAIKDEFQSITFKKEAFSKEEIFRIFDTKINQEIVAFKGSPLKGMQILGLFETRSLSFENVIVMDVHEGALPRLNIYDPLIPREVMISLNLDRLELEEEIQRYQFMRLISSAKHVHLIYQESKDKEKSRFLEELIWEEQKKTQRLDVCEPRQAGFSVKVSPQRKTVKKTPAMISFLKDFKYSASSLNTYLRNPLDFYYNYVLGLREKEDLLDEPEARQVGTFIHKLLEHTFYPFLNKQVEINAAFREWFFRQFENQFAQTFGKSGKSDSFLLKAVIAQRLHRFLDHEAESEDRQIEKILYLEQRFEDTVPLSCGDIRFNYIVDRVDQMPNGTIMIIDYKTGSIDQMPKDIGLINAMSLSRETIRDNVCSFQIPLYFYYLNKHYHDRPINAALYNLRTMTMKTFIDPSMPHSREKINETFLKVLDYTMNEILNPNIDFIEDNSGTRT